MFSPIRGRYAALGIRQARGQTVRLLGLGSLSLGVVCMLRAWDDMGLLYYVPTFLLAAAAACASHLPTFEAMASSRVVTPPARHAVRTRSAHLNARKVSRLFMARKLAICQARWPRFLLAMPERHFPDLGLTLEVVTTLERLEGLRPDYDQLHVVANVGLPFQLHEWHVSWWRAFASSSIKLRDQLLFHVVRSAADGCVGIVPLVLTERPGYGPLRIGTLALIGTDQYITELRKPTIAPGFEAKVGEVVRRSLASDGRWDWAHWTGSDPEFARALAPLGTSDPLDDNPDYVLHLAPTWDEFRSGLKRNIRESIRHCYNSLKRENLTPELVVAKTPAEIRSGLDRFIQLHAARADLDDTVAHPDRFATPMTRGFLYDVCLRLAARDISRVFLLKIGDAIVAARVGFEMNDTLYLYYSGFDPNWRKYSVMTTLVTEAVKYAIERGRKTVNLSAGTDVSKTRWGAREVPFAETLQLRSRARSKLASKAYQTAKTANTNHPLVKVLLRALPRRQWGGTQG